MLVTTSFANSCRYFNLHYLCFNLHSAIKYLHLWFNFAPLHLLTPFECKQPLQRLLRQSCARSSVFYPPPYYYGFYGTDFITTTGSSATSTLLNKSLSLNLFLLSPLYQNTGTKVKASPVKQTILYRNASVITFSRIRILGFGTFCNLTPTDRQNRFTLAMFTVLTKPSFTPCRCQQRTWLRIAFPPVRRRSSLASCRIGLHAGQTKKAP
jgi:hypothetical protein